MSFSSHVRDLEGAVYRSGVSPRGASTYELIEDDLALRALESEWRALYERSIGHYLSETWAWANASWETTAFAPQCAAMSGAQGAEILVPAGVAVPP